MNRYWSLPGALLLTVTSFGFSACDPFVSEQQRAELDAMKVVPASVLRCMVEERDHEVGFTVNALEGGQLVVVQNGDRRAVCWVKDGVVYGVGGNAGCVDDLPPVPSHLAALLNAVAY